MSFISDLKVLFGCMCVKEEKWWLQGKGIFCTVSTSADKWMSPELHIACVVSCPLFSSAYTESVWENELHFAFINYFTVLWKQSDWSLFAQAMTSGGVSGAGAFFFLSWKESRGEGGSSCSADIACLPALVPTDTKTNIRERNESNFAPPHLF